MDTQFLHQTLLPQLFERMGLKTKSMNTFLVTSPLQLLNATEAREHFQTKNNTLIVLRNTTQGFPLSMFKRFIQEDEWDQIHYLATYDSEKVATLGRAHWFYLRMRQRFQLVKLAAALGENEGLFIGNYHDPLNYYFSRALSYDCLYLVDDGTTTLEVNGVRQQAANGRLPRYHVLKREFGSRAPDNWAEKLIFFSAYTFIPRPGDLYVANQYRYLRQSVTEAVTGDEVWFLGGPLWTAGYLTRDMYLHYLKLVRNFYKDSTFIYLPHSREPQAEVEKIGQALNCEVRRYGLPVELALARENPRPKEVATFISAAMTNCHIIFGNTLQLTSFVLETEQLLGWHDLVASIYQHFREEADAGFRVLELKVLT